MMKKIPWMLALVGVLALAGCDKKPSGTAPGASATAAGGGAAAAEALTVFNGKCVVCHGQTGKGDGAGAAALEPKPRNFGDAKWQDSVTDEQIKKTIIGGGLAVGKSAVMPGNPDLKGKDAVLDELVKKIRSFKGS